MPLRPKPLALALCLSLFCSLAAQPVFSAESEPGKDSGWREQAWENFKSPVTTDARMPLLIGLGVTATLLLFEDQIVDPTQREAVEHKPLGSFSKIGDYGGRGYTNAAYVVGMLGYGYLNSDAEAKQNANSMFQATLFSTLITTGLKYTVREPRPDTNSRESFPSGHTTAAFAFAGYIGCKHSLPWGIAAYSLAAFVGFSRVNDNRHYIHDVTAGAAIGAAYGLGTCLQESVHASDSSGKTQVSWAVAPIREGLQTQVSLRF